MWTTVFPRLDAVATILDSAVRLQFESGHNPTNTNVHMLVMLLHHRVCACDLASVNVCAVK